jgi:starch phosphorylase
LHRLGLDLEEMIDVENDAGLGNGGLGRLAACFLDSCATLQLPVMGYGIRYEYGMFRQRIENGRQARSRITGCARATPGNWSGRNIRAASSTAAAPRFTRAPTTASMCAGLIPTTCWRCLSTRRFPAIKNDTVNVLRLWSAAATDEFDLGEFNAGSYPESVAAKNAAENITMVLYPNDSQRERQGAAPAPAVLPGLGQPAGCAGALGAPCMADFSQFAEKNCFQLNDTHPSCAVPELMRLLMDEHGLEWDRPGTSPPDHGLHQPHAVAGSPGEMAGAPVRPAAAAHPGDHPRDQRPLPGRGGAALAGRQRARRACP